MEKDFHIPYTYTQYLEDRKESLYYPISFSLIQDLNSHFNISSTLSFSINLLNSLKLLIYS